MSKISAVINTFNEEVNLEHCLNSIKSFADEIVVVDMHSNDKTVKIAEKFGAKVFYHYYTGYVEPARNFAIQCAQGEYILIIDADEELSPTLAKKLKKIAEENQIDYVEIPRKNIIFGKWIKHSRWWPDYQVRFFKKGKVRFPDKIHIPPSTKGKGVKLPLDEESAIIHYNYQSISQFIHRADRYSDIQANELFNDGYSFDTKDLLKKPAEEFFSRFYLAEGYKDGLHGLVLALLQGFSVFLIYLKVWEKNKFEEKEIKNVNSIFQKIIKDFFWWQRRFASNFLTKIRLKIKESI